MSDRMSVFQLLICASIQKIVLKMTSLVGSDIYGQQWKDIDVSDFHAYLQIIILAGVFNL